MTNTLFMLLVVIKTEIQLFVRRTSFWIFLLSLCLLTIVAVFSLDTHHSSNWLDAVIRIVNNLAFYQFALIAILVAPAGIRNRHKIGDWLWTTSLQSPILVLGQMIGLALCTCVGLFVSLGLAWLILTVKGLTSLSNLPAFSLFFLMLMLPITLLELSIAFSLTFSLGRVAPAILVAIVLSSLVWLGVLMPTASLSTPLNYTLLTLNLDPVAGFGAESGFLSPLFSFYLAFSLFILLLSVYAGSKIDNRSGWKPQNRWYIFSLLLIAASFALFSFYSYQLSVERRTVPTPITAQVNTWTVLSSSSSGTITHTGIEVATLLMLQNESNQEQASLILSLNTGLEVSEVFVNNRLINPRRVGETIHLDFPTTPVGQGESVTIKVLYDGVPQLLREDYALVKDVKNGTNPTAFQQPNLTYLDRNIIFLQRDANWLVWPLSSGPHIATQETELTLTVLSKLPTVSSGQILEQNQSQTTYYWSKDLPLFLVAVGPYHIHHSSNNDILIPPYSNNYDIQYGELALSLRQAFLRRTGVDGLNDHAQAVILPYTQQIVISDSIIGLPSIGRVGNWQNGQQANGQKMIFDMAANYSRAWLLEHVAWHMSELNTEGQLRSSITICGPPDENGKQQCEVRGLGGVNPQAPQGRLIEKENDSPLLRALSIYLGQLLVTDIVEDGDQWMLSSEQTNSDKALAVNNLLISQHEDFNQCQANAIILAIDHIYDDSGESTFTQMLNTLIEQYPIGREPVTEDAFWLIAGQFTNDIDELREAELDCFNLKD